MKDIRFIRNAALALVAFAATLPALAERDVRVGLPNRGALHLKVPEGWNERIARPDPKLPPSIMVTPANGSAFKILLFPAWPQAETDKLPEPPTIREMLEAGANAARAVAVEATIPVIEVKGMQAVGSYFSATDRKPEVGDYKHLTQGLVRVGDIIVSFRVYGDGDKAVLDSAIRMVRLLRHST